MYHICFAVQNYVNITNSIFVLIVALQIDDSDIFQCGMARPLSEIFLISRHFIPFILCYPFRLSFIGILACT